MFRKFMKLKMPKAFIIFLERTNYYTYRYKKGLKIIAVHD